MARNILAWILIIFSSLFLLLSAGGIVAAWAYNEPLTRRALAQLQNIDNELAQAEVTLASTQAELERALRILDAAQTALEKLAEQSASADNLLEGIQSSLDDNLLPELRSTRERLAAARVALESLRTLLESIGSLPFLDLRFPDQVLADLIASADALDTEIAGAEDLAQRASTFVSDTSYLLGGDLNETRVSLQNFLSAAETYHQKVVDWRKQIGDWRDALPAWMDRASLVISLFLFWFGLSQFSLFLHGRLLLRGENPLQAWRS